MYGSPTCFGITLPSLGNVPSAFWEMLNWGAVDRILWMGVLCLVTWCARLYKSFSVKELIVLLSLIRILTPWLYGLLRALASLITDTHSSLSTAYRRDLLTFTSRGPKSSSHLNLRFPLLQLPSRLLSNISPTVLPDLFLLHDQSIPTFYLKYLLLCLDLYMGFSIPS
jgi:hypothetical protein